MNKIQVNGILQAYERRGSGSVPLVLIHGYPLDHSIWDQTAALLEDDFDLILPDMRGFGESSVGEAPYSIGDIAGDLAALLDGLGIEKAAIAGHSMGGYVALSFAMKFPQRTHALALVASQAAGDSPERREMRYKMAADVALNGVRPIAEDMPNKLSQTQSIRDGIHLLIEKQSVPGIAGALRAMAEREDATTFIAAFKKPLVLVHCMKDDLIPIDRAQEIKSLLPAAQLVELEGTGHLPMMEFPVQTANALKLLK